MATLRKHSCRMEPETNLKFCNTYLYQFTIALQKSHVFPLKSDAFLMAGQITESGHVEAIPYQIFICLTQK
jgi:hypothetical protein